MGSEATPVVPAVAGATAIGVVARGLGLIIITQRFIGINKLIN